MQLRVNYNPIERHSLLLQGLHRSAYPTAIRASLNDAVFDVKTNTMPLKAKVFKKRQPNFFRANSKFEKAQGFNVSTMKAVVGFFENKLADASTNYAVKDLEEQEKGGTIKRKSLIAMRGARKNNKNVKDDFRLKKLKGKKFVKTSSTGKNSRGQTINVRSLKQRFIRAAIYAASKYGKNAFVLGGRNANGNKTLSLINEIRTGGRFTNRYAFELSRTPIYSVRKGRTTKVSATNFMKRASLETGAKMNVFFIKQAQIQFRKFNRNY